jgi:hypothetical protein
VAGKLNKVNAIMSRIKNQVPTTILKTIYNGLFLPHIQYGILVWGSVNLQRLFQLQKKAIRNIDQTFYKAHTDPIFKKHQLLKMHDLFKLKCIKLYGKLVTNQAVPFLTKLWGNYKETNKHPENFHHNLRVSNLNIFKLPKIKLTLEKQRILYSLITSWNSSAPAIRDIFLNNKALKTYMLNEYNAVCNVKNCYVCTSR